MRLSFSDWLDRQADRLFILPAVLILLTFSIFPLLISAYLALSRFQLTAGGYQLRFVGWLNFKKLLFGGEQYHFLGVFVPVPWYGWLLLALVILLLARSIAQYIRSGKPTLFGLIGRAVTTAAILALALLLAATIGAGGQLGSLSVTVIYVAVGVTCQLLIGLGLAMLCSQNIRCRGFFRVVFFLPLMVTPVGIAYTFRMLADMTQGPLAGLWRFVGLGDLSWASQAWSARLVVMVGDTWQWTPFIFIVLLAAIEGQSREQVEAASLDGASYWQIFRDVTWPEIAPVASTIVLIRVIEAFKIVDLPNVLTNGGPGIATESLTLHSFINWRALDLGGSAAVAYMLLIVSTVLCASFFNYVMQPMRSRRQ
ncbi:MAG TPA: sugar ABC transporter permease [Dongiaceae bacterium]|nr:sugar ABC transporter permease [Dongiaceae bacterium]